MHGSAHAHATVDGADCDASGAAHDAAYDASAYDGAWSHDAAHDGSGPADADAAGTA